MFHVHLSFKFPTRTSCISLLSHACCMLCLFHPTWFHHGGWDKYGQHKTGSLVTMTWHALRFLMEELSIRYGGQLGMYWISKHRQATSGCLSSAGLGRRLTIPHFNKSVCYKCYAGSQTWMDFSKRPKEVKWVGTEWIHQAPDRDQQCALLDTVKNNWVP
jgi:hypothetical protein